MANLARVPRTIDNSRATYLLPFDNGYYHVPAENVLLYPKWTNNEVEATVTALLNSHDPSDWSRFIAYGRVAHIRGREGSAVYTTFAGRLVSDCLCPRILHQVPFGAAHECFPALKEWSRCAYAEPRNARQQARIDVYDWRWETDLPQHFQIDPVANGWPRADFSDPNMVRDPMLEYEEFLEQRAQPPSPPPPPIPSGVREIGPWEYNPWRLPPPVLLPRQPPPTYSGRADDLRKLSEFLFECKDVAPEGAYLEASNALQRLWDNVV